MKIAMLGQKRIPSREGGVEIVVEELSTRMVKKGHKVIYDTDTIRCSVRREIIKEIEGSNFLERAMKILQDLSPIFVIIARLIATLILGILSIDRVKVLIKPETLAKFNKVVEKAMTYY